MTSYYTREYKGPTVSDYYYTAPPPVSRTTSATRTPRTNARSSPMAASPAAYSGTYTSTHGTRPTRPPLTRAPPLPPRTSSQTSLHSAKGVSSRGTSSATSSVRGTPSRPSLRTPRASFDVASTSSHAKHVAFTSDVPRQPLKPANAKTSDDDVSAACPFPLSIASFTLPPSVSLKMHPFLAHATFRRAAVSYDIHYPPSSPALMDRRARTPVPAATLAEPATAPALPSNARLTLTHSALPWAVTVSPSSSGGGSARRTAITILDVLSAVHASLHRPAGKDDWDALGAGSGAQRRVRHAFESRCARAGEREKGLKRLDWLAGKTRLSGIEVDRNARSATARLVFSSPKA